MASGDIHSYFVKLYANLPMHIGYVAIITSYITKYIQMQLLFLSYAYSYIRNYRIRQNIRGGKLSRFINNMHYVGKTFAVCRLTASKLLFLLCKIPVAQAIAILAFTTPPTLRVS